MLLQEAMGTYVLDNLTHARLRDATAAEEERRVLSGLAACAGDISRDGGPCG